MEDYEYVSEDASNVKYTNGRDHDFSSIPQGSVAVAPVGRGRKRAGGPADTVERLKQDVGIELGTEWERAPSGRLRLKADNPDNPEFWKRLDELAVELASDGLATETSNGGPGQWSSEDEIWAHARHGGGRGFIGIDEAIRDATAWLYRNKPAWSDDQIVEHVLRRVQKLHSEQCPKERWDWRQERREIEDKLQRYPSYLKQQDVTKPNWRRSPGAAAEARAQIQAGHEKMTALEYGVSIMRAGAQWSDDHKRVLLNKMNAEHAVVSIGSSTRYLHRVTAPDGQTEMRFLRAEDMRVTYEAVRVPMEQTTATGSSSTTKTKLVSAFELWRLSPERQQYDGIGFFPPPRKAPPRWLNLWTGLAVERKQGDWSLFREHLFNVVCGSNQEWFDWLLDYLAHAVQRPGEKPGSAVVLYSPAEGTGKTIVNVMMKRIFGQHAIGVAKSEQFLGRFNAAVGSKVWLATEEAFWGGDKKQLGAYKNLITEDRITLEPKGIDPYEVDNFTRIFATSNEAWNTPAGVEGRRFFVLEVKNQRAKDRDYFDPIWKQMLEGGGLEAMLFDLFERDIKSNLRNPPETPALMAQRQLTLDGVQQWLWGVAEDGGFYDRVSESEITLEETKAITVRRKVLIDAAVSALPRMKPGEVRTQLGQLLPRLGVTPGRETTGQRKEIYTLPSRDAFRDRIEDEFRLNVDA